MSAGHVETLTAAPSGADEPLAPGKALGRYTIDRLLGKGGMGVVYAAHDPDLDRPVALKLLRGRSDDFARARLLREARAMAKVVHPNVVTVFEVDTINGLDFVAMELIDGVSVDRWVATPRSLTEILDVFLRAASGLAAAHDKGLVHRDFKPHNVLVGRDGRIVVTDFGLARAVETVGGAADDAAPVPAPAGTDVTGPTREVPRVDVADLATPIRGDEETMEQSPEGATPAAPVRSGGTTPSWSQTLTATGALLGTPAYMAPEQWAGGSADQRCDQFAFCVSLWESVSSERPFRGKNLAELQSAVEKGPPPAPRGIPAWLAPILRRGLAVNPAERWPSMRALVDAIDHGRGRGRRRAIAAGAIALVLVGGGIAAVAAGSGNGRKGGGNASVSARASAAAEVALGGTGSSSPAPASGDTVCQPVDTAMVGLWTDERRARMNATLASTPKLAAFVDKHFTLQTAEWRNAYQQACADRGDRQRLVRVACLESWRDTFAGYIDGFVLVPGETLQFIPFAEMLPSFEMCTGAMPVMPPLAPSDDQREKVREHRAQNAVLWFRDHVRDDAIWLERRKLAEAIGYPPLVVEIDLIRASMRESEGDLVAARTLFAQTANAAETNGVAILRADALLGLLSIDIAEKKPPATIEASLKAARAAVTAAGSSTVRRLALDETEASIAYERGDYATAIAILTRIQPEYIALHATHRAFAATEGLAESLYARNRVGDRELAINLLRAEADRERTELGDQAVYAAQLDTIRERLARPAAGHRATE